MICTKRLPCFRNFRQTSLAFSNFEWSFYFFQEGEPNDPQLKRLQREIDEVNRLFDEWERRAAMEEERRNAAKLFNDRCNSLEVSLSEFEKQIIKVWKIWKRSLYYFLYNWFV